MKKMTVEMARKVMDIFDECIKDTTNKEMSDIKLILKQKLTDNDITYGGTLKELIEHSRLKLENTKGTKEYNNIQYWKHLEEVVKKHPFDNKERADAIDQLEFRDAMVDYMK